MTVVHSRDYTPIITGHHYNKCLTIYDLTEKFIIYVINYLDDDFVIIMMSKL